MLVPLPPPGNAARSAGVGKSGSMLRQSRLCRPDRIESPLKPHSLYFVFAGAEHEGFDGFAGVLAFIEDQLHLLGDGHFYAMLAGEAEGGAGGQNAFGDLSAQ
jgi:hypothetical protein